MLKYFVAAMLIISPAIAMDLSREAPDGDIEVAQALVNTAEKCAVSSEAEFIINVSKLKPVMKMAPPATLDKIMSYVNKNRMDNGSPPFEATKFLIGIFMQGTQMKVGVVMIDKFNCVVVGSVVSMSADQFVQIMTSIGVSIDDFIDYKEA